jgi:hypothetical protein
VIDPFTGAPFANDQIPALRISPIVKNLFRFFPPAQISTSDPISGVNYFGIGSTSINDDQRNLRIDHQVSVGDKLFGHYAFDDISYVNQYAPNPNFPYFVSGRNQNAGINWIHIFTPSVINEARAGYMRSVDNTLNPRTNTSFNLDSLGMTGFRVLNDNNRPLSAREAGLPPITFSGFTQLGDRDGGNSFDYNNQYEVNDNLTIAHDAHNFKTGFAFTRVALNRGAVNVARGDVNFTDDVANSAWASFLLGVPTSSDTPEGLPLTYPRQNRFAGYFQDDWKATQRLTINAGLRYEYNTAAVDVRGLWRSLSFSHIENGYPTLVPEHPHAVHFYNPDKRLLQPRLGAAYRVSEKTVIRTGAGIYYNVHQLNNYTILDLNPPLSGSVAFANTASNEVITNPNPISFANPFSVANTLNPQDFEPRIMQWSLGIQRQLPWNSVLVVSYVGSKGVHIDNTVELNYPDPGLSSLPTTPQQRRPYQFVTDGFGGPVPPDFAHPLARFGCEFVVPGAAGQLPETLE